jgi:hypothetical protein
MNLLGGETRRGGSPWCREGWLFSPFSLEDILHTMLHAILDWHKHRPLMSEHLAQSGVTTVKR